MTFRLFLPDHNHQVGDKLALTAKTRDNLFQRKSRPRELSRPDYRKKGNDKEILPCNKTLEYFEHYHLQLQWKFCEKRKDQTFY